MSATGRGAKRRGLDFYETPPWATWAVVPWLPFPHDTQRRIIDYGCGTGAIGKVLRLAYPDAEIVGVELDTKRARAAVRAEVYDHVWIGDIFSPPRLSGHAAIFNPPYCIAEKIVREAILSCDISAALLAMNFKSSKGRRQWLKSTKPFELVLPERPSYCSSFKCKNCTAQRTMPTKRKTLDCIVCGAKMSRTATDARDYSWFIWGIGRSQQWRIAKTQKEVMQMQAAGESAYT